MTATERRGGTRCAAEVRIAALRLSQSDHWRLGTIGPAGGVRGRFYGGGYGRFYGGGYFRIFAVL
jgi:hypothetical protein